MKKALGLMVLSLGLCAAMASGALAQSHLRIGLAEDPDVLDPTLARTYVGRIVFAGLCDKLFDINEKLEIVPQLATGYEWVDSKTLLIHPFQLKVRTIFSITDIVNQATTIHQIIYFLGFSGKI